MREAKHHHNSVPLHFTVRLTISPVFIWIHGMKLLNLPLFTSATIRQSYDPTWFKQVWLGVLADSSTEKRHYGYWCNAITDIDVTNYGEFLRSEPNVNIVFHRVIMSTLGREKSLLSSVWCR